VEYAPSAVRDETPSLLRITCGFGGLFFSTLGVATLVMAPMGRGFFDVGWGYLFLAVGVCLSVIHALRDGDYEVRRLYGGAGGLLLIAAVIVGVFPAKPDEASAAVAGQLLMPYGALLGLLSLLFLTAFARHETAEPFMTWVRLVLLGTGGLLVVAAVLIGIVQPTLMAGSGAVLGLLGLAFLFSYFTLNDATVGMGYKAVLGLGIVGVVAVAYALGRSLFPYVLHDGPSVLRKASQQFDAWFIAGRVFMIFLGLSLLLVLLKKNWMLWVRAGVAGFGLVFAAVYIVGSFSRTVAVEPPPYFIPGGLVLLLLGLAACALAAGLVLDSPLVVLTRRELASFFTSPVGYIVLLGNALVASVTYLMFIGALYSPGGLSGTLEPIVTMYWGLSMGAAFTTPVLVAAITMRSFSEERRANTIEVLLTAPVQEWEVVLSKFAAALAFFMLCWVPAGLYLVVLRYAGGKPFDFRPVLSYYLAMLACGVSFVGLGNFISSLTRNQIIAAVLTFAALFAMLLTATRESFREVLGAGFIEFLGKFDYFQLWNVALSGQLLVPQVFVHVSLGVFWLFLTMKVLEFRKWG
jgi:ABC-2 type transport system permease protein